MNGIARRIVLSLTAIAVLGGATLALALAGGRFGINATAPLRAQGPKPVAIAGMAPGDRAQRTIVLVNRTRAPIRRIGFTLDERRNWTPGKVVRAPRGRTTPAGFRWERTCRITTRPGTRRKVRRCTTRLRRAPTILVTDRTGLVATLETCTKPWRRLPTAAPTYTCPGRARTLVRTRRLPIRANLRRLPPNRPGGRIHFRLTLALPAGAGNNLQGAAVTLAPTFVAGGLR